MTSGTIKTIETTAGLLLVSSSVIEVRLVGGGQVMSGVFSDSIIAAAEVAKVDGGRNVYIVANPIRSQWLPPATDRFARAGKSSCVGDKDIARRAWFMVDIDSKGKGKLSATAAEVEASARVRDRIAVFLASYGWPAPLIGFSGNGWWLFYSVDLPNDDVTKLLFDDALGVLALKFNGDGCEIDLSASTATRLVPFFGTLKMKGENTEERPHRIAPQSR